MLSFSKVSYETPLPRSVSIFDEASFSVDRSCNTVIYGENGSGKTTLAHLLLEFIQPASGEITGGRELSAGVFENVDEQLLFSSVKEEISSSACSLRDYESVLKDLALEGLIGKTTFEISYSQKARLVMAAAYLTGKEFIIVDSVPEDEIIDEFIRSKAEAGERTFLLLLPEGDVRETGKNWNRLYISRGKIFEL